MVRSHLCSEGRREAPRFGARVGARLGVRASRWHQHSSQPPPLGLLVPSSLTHGANHSGSSDSGSHLGVGVRGVEWSGCVMGKVETRGGT